MAQLRPDNRPQVTINNHLLKYPWTGGLNSVILNEIDLDGDGDMDLLLLDRVGNRLTTFLNDGITHQVSYTYAPQYQLLFPPLHDWVRTADYDCDGDMDLFTYTNAAIGVWQNDFTPGTGLSFSLVTPKLNSWYDTLHTNIFVTQVNLPAFADVDSDSDLDIITFTNSGNFLEYHENYSFDSTGICGGFNFKLDPSCWGHFTLSGLSNVAVLNQNCASVNRMSDARHSGSVLIPFDHDCDGDIDLLNGDILGENLLFLQNGGIPDSAYITAQDSAFPVYDVEVSMQNLPGPHLLDADNDGFRDLLVSPFATVGEDYTNMHLYRNTTDNCSNIFQRVNTRFLIEDIIDLGTSSNVAFVDVDADGLTDIVAGNDMYYNPDPALAWSRFAYFRNTGTSQQPAFTLVNDNYLNASSLHVLGLSPAFGDIDGDNDLDLIAGVADGKLLLFQNTAGAGNPLNLVFTQASYQGIDVGNNSTPQIIDVDRDGLNDLLLGERAGNLNYYRNTGTVSVPAFTLASNTFGGVNVLVASGIAGYSTPLLYDSAGTYRLLVGSDSGIVYLYDNIDGNLTGSFTLTDSSYYDIIEPDRVTIAIADLDADGKSDLLTGCHAGGMRFYSHSTSVGINEAPAPVFNLYPNPAKSAVTLQFTSASDRGRIITITDITGKMVHRATCYDRFASLLLTSLPGGMYLVNVTEGEKSFSHKLIIAP